MTDQDPQPRRRRRTTPETPPPAQGSVAKGAILVAVAVIIGFVLIRDDGITTQTSAVGADIGVDVDEPETPATDDTTVEDTTEDSAPDARDPANVRVLVANGTSVNGAAGRFTDMLATANYQTASATDAIDKGVDATSVYYTAGYEAEAKAVATAIKAPAENVKALPAAPIVNDAAMANVIVVIGPELANS